MQIQEEILPEIYAISLEVYEGKIKLTEGAQILSEDYNLNNGSARIYIQVFKSLMNGTKFKRSLNAYSMDFLLQNIKFFFGDERLKLALTAFQKHIHYYEATHNMTMHKLRGVYNKYLEMVK